MPVADIEARFKAQQQQIEDLGGQLKDLVDGVIDLAAEECHRFADDVAAAKQFVESLQAPTA